MYEGTERDCAQCGHTFRSYANLKCTRCRATQRNCVTCGQSFRGRDRECYQCKATDRACIVCGKTFHGVKRTCLDCLAVERLCEICGETFRGNKNTCPSCSAKQRICVLCGRQFHGTSVNCPRCFARDRECEVCGKSFHGYQTICRSCRVSTRVCVTCRRPFRGDQVECATCRYVERECVTCGRTFRSSFYRECGTCSGRTHVVNNRRRARMLAAQVDGPLSRTVYVRILESGPCVYCAAPAVSIDHVRPLAGDGTETEDNLVPACEACNKSKQAKPLISWDLGKVTHGAACSPAVAAELERELADDAIRHSTSH